MNARKASVRMLSFLLALCMFVGLLPLNALRVNAAETAIDAAIFCSDVHGDPNAVTAVFNGIKNADSAFNPSTASFVGDTQADADGVSAAAQAVYAGAQCVYGTADFTGLSYAGANYYIYTIGADGMSASTPDISGFAAAVAGMDATKPLFIVSHLPLHGSNDNQGAAAWYNAISAAAEQMDIFVFWAQNGDVEEPADQEAYYVAKDGSETITLADGSAVIPNFTYANAGYVAHANNPARNQVATAVRIYADSVNLTVYDASGELGGAYAVNETVTREFAAPVEETTAPAEETTAPVEDTTSDKGIVVPTEEVTLSEEETIAPTEEITLSVEGVTETDEETAIFTESNGNNFNQFSNTQPVEETGNDFPEYPNEGAIRFDKTATAVGNFSETGITQVELSMTGVPYSTGSEVDVVIVLDASTSMIIEDKGARIAAAKEAAYELVKQICQNKDGSYNNNRVAIVFFGDNGKASYPVSGLTLGLGMKYQTKYGYALSNVTSMDDINNVIYNNYPDLGLTNYSNGLAIAEAILTNARTDGTGNNRQQFCVFMSDGAATGYKWVKNYNPAVRPTESQGTTGYNLDGNAVSRYEYFSSQMKYDGVKVYCVGTAMTATSDANAYGFMKNIASSEDYLYFVSEDDVANGALQNTFGNIAVKIQQAAIDVTVEDQITPEYTMIFDLPEGTKDIEGVTNDFYIEFVEYVLDAEHERTDTVTSLTKLYLKNDGDVYSAAKDASGTAYDAPTFEARTIGEKGSLYYWTTDSAYELQAALSYSDGTNTYYFIPYGMKATADGFDASKWFNMTSGGYAHGTVDAATNMSDDLVIATPYFVYNASTRMLYWTVDKLGTTEYALRYFLYMDSSATELGSGNAVPPGTYQTNDHAYITYTNFRGNECRQEMPVPQLTWNGAQVSYVFYLVNAQGQPINKSGQVVDFANATFITDVFTTAVVWNKDENGITGDSQLSADWLASEKLPGEYTIYDELAGYELHVYAKPDGQQQNRFTIEGDTAENISASLNTRIDGLNTTAAAVSTDTTKVYNTRAGEKFTQYGTYYSTDEDMAGFDFANTTVAFAVVWEPSLTPDTIVVDYGMDVLIDVIRNDNLQNTISGIGLGKEAYGNIAMNSGVSTDPKLGTNPLAVDGNTISIENGNQIRFHQGDMQFRTPVVFYYESPVEFYEGSVKQQGYMYSSVTVIPATTVYYEESFVELKVYTDADDQLFWTDSDGNSDTDRREWEVAGTVTNGVQDTDRPGQNLISEQYDADNVYGYDSAYTELSTYSMDSARVLKVDPEYFGTAEFSFYGTGFDVISMTSNSTGTIVVRVMNASGEVVRSKVVDTFYGYSLVNGEWVVENNNPNALYQVPVITVEDLDYGKYSVIITAAYNKFFDHVDSDKETGTYDLYLDAIRIYDPTGNLNDTANDAYLADGEAWPIYTELRNNIIGAQNVVESKDEDGNTVITGTNLNGPIFIDSDNGTKMIADYVSFGPNNELYLAKGQSIAFRVSTNDNVADVQLGIKSATGAEVTYTINDDTYTVATTTDLYYSILTYTDDNAIVITNTSDGILSLTNLKVTHEADPGAASSDDMVYMTEEAATWSLRRLRSANVTEPTEPETEPTEPETEPTEPETKPTEPETEPTEPETKPTEPETEPTEPETEPTEPETEPTEPETEPTEPETEPTEPENEGSNSGSKVESVIRKIGKIIRKIFGWLFG